MSTMKSGEATVPMTRGNKHCLRPSPMVIKLYPYPHILHNRCSAPRIARPTSYVPTLSVVEFETHPLHPVRQAFSSTRVLVEGFGTLPWIDNRRSPLRVPPIIRQLSSQLQFIVGVARNISTSLTTLPRDSISPRVAIPQTSTTKCVKPN